MREITNEDGLIIVEFHNAKIILEELHYDSIYHEHLYYHTIQSMSTLLNKHGIYPFDWSEGPISGGSTILYCKKVNIGQSEELKRAKVEEIVAGVHLEEKWLEFGRRSEVHKKELKDCLEEYKTRGKVIIGYGASARSSTMTNYCGIDSTILSCIIDNSKLKQGLYTAGTCTRIVEKEVGLGLKPDVILLLAWNFKDEIIEEIKESGWKGEIIIPLPWKIQKIILV